MISDSEGEDQPPSALPLPRPPSAHTLPTSFASTDKFFGTCSAHLQATHGINAWRDENETHYAKATCSKRKKGCPWKAVIEPEDDGTWSLSSSRTHLVHQHDGAAASSPRKGREEAERGATAPSQSSFCGFSVVRWLTSDTP